MKMLKLVKQDITKKKSTHSLSVTLKYTPSQKCRGM